MYRVCVYVCVSAYKIDFSQGNNNNKNTFTITWH